MNTTGISGNAVAIRPIQASEYSKACDLVMAVFNKYNAEECTEEGLRMFSCIARPDVIAKGMLEGDVTWVAATEKKVIGVIKIHRENHIHLLFVDDTWHGKGIARQLFEAALLHVRENYPEKLHITVNSSSFAVPVYRALGFTTTGSPASKHGVRIVAMSFDVQ